MTELLRTSASSVVNSTVHTYSGNASLVRSTTNTTVILTSTGAQSVTVNPALYQIGDKVDVIATEETGNKTISSTGIIDVDGSVSNSLSFEGQLTYSLQKINSSAFRVLGTTPNVAGEGGGGIAVIQKNLTANSMTLDSEASEMVVVTNSATPKAVAIGTEWTAGKRLTIHNKHASSLTTITGSTFKDSNGGSDTTATVTGPGRVFLEVQPDNTFLLLGYTSG